MLALDLFTGIGGFTLAGERCGIRTVAFCEINRFARKVLAKHWPEVPCFEDVRAVTVYALRERGVGRVELITFGFPCTDLSMAGKRAGLAGGQSGLFWEALRLARDLRPNWLVAENVPGLRSSNDGQDMATVVRAFAELGYVGAWRSLDAQFFGLAQRRERVFFVAGAGERGFRAIHTLLEGGRRYPAPRRETGAPITSAVEGGAGVYGVGRKVDGVARALNAKGGSGRLDGESETFVCARTLHARGNLAHREDHDTIVVFDTTQVTSRVNASNPKPGGPCHTLAAGADLPTIVHTLRGEGFDGSEDGTGRGTPLVAFNWRAGGSKAHVGASGTHTSALHSAQAPAIAFMERTRDGGRVLDTQEELAYTLTNPGAGGRTHARQVLTPHSKVRRLTPTECELLQGFPFGHTCLCGLNEGRSVAPEGQHPCRCKDGPRYRALGNAVAVPVAEWVLRCVTGA